RRLRVRTAIADAKFRPASAVDPDRVVPGVETPGAAFDAVARRRAQLADDGNWSIGNGALRIAIVLRFAGDDHPLRGNRAREQRCRSSDCARCEACLDVHAEPPAWTIAEWRPTERRSQYTPGFGSGSERLDPAQQRARRLFPLPFQHHHVRESGQDLSVDAVMAGGCANVIRGADAVAVGAQNEKRSAATLREL